MIHSAGHGEQKGAHELRDELARCFCLCVVAVIMCFCVPATASSYEERIIVSRDVNNCSIRVEADDQSHTVRLRVHPEKPDCGITREAVQSVLKEAFSKTTPPKLEGTYSSLFMGRLVDYPWLSQYLATTAFNDKGWNRTRGKHRSGNTYKYVASILSGPEVVSPIEESFGDSGYRIVSATVEKILVGSYREVPMYEGEQFAGKVPYDCMVWFRLDKR